MSRLVKTFGFLAISFLAIVSMTISLLPKPSAAALNGSDFNAGHIIDDKVFYDDNAMSATQIQTFLNSKVPNCDTNGSNSYSYHYRASPLRLNNANDPVVTTTRAVYGQRYFNKYGAAKGSKAPFVCLKDFKMDTEDIAPESGICGNYVGANNESAATIIYKVAKACDINPQVLIVTLEKEQSLVTDVWPWGIQYTKAMGYNCPDSPPAGDNNGNGCVDATEGFFRQVFQGARRFKIYKANPNGYNYRAGRNNTILYNPNTSCGSSSVFIQNQATAALYIYTPYRPNQAALNNLYGTGNSCSSYGVRNFWRLFNDWFGSTLVPWKSLSDPRWMQTKTDVYKKDPFTGEDTGSLVPAGTLFFFPSKITVSGNSYLRTQTDHNNVSTRGFLQSDLEEADLTFASMAEPRWMKIVPDKSKKIDVRRNKKVDVITLASGFEVFFSTKITIDGRVYLRSQYDTINNLEYVIPIDSLEDVTISYTPFLQPRFMVTTKSTKNYDLRYPGGTTTDTIPIDTPIYLDKKVKINGKTYFTGDELEDGEFLGTPLEAVRNIESVDFVPATSQRAYQVMYNIQKTELKTGMPSEDPTDPNPVSSGTVVVFVEQITLGGLDYLRSAYDSDHDKTTVVPLSALDPISTNFVSMAKPRKLKLNKSARKLDAVTLRKVMPILDKGRKISFSEKIEINNIVYLRTTYDTENGHSLVIPLSLLSEI